MNLHVIDIEDAFVVVRWGKMLDIRGAKLDGKIQLYSLPCLHSAFGRDKPDYCPVCGKSTSERGDQ